MLPQRLKKLDKALLPRASLANAAARDCFLVSSALAALEITCAKES